VRCERSSPTSEDTPRIVGHGRAIDTRRPCEFACRFSPLRTAVAECRTRASDVPPYPRGWRGGTIRSDVPDRILIIDDERSVHDVARAYLEREGYEVVSAIGGRDGLALAQALHPSLVVLDLMLPDLSGDEVCAALRRDSDVAIVMLTAKSTEDDRIRGLDLGADDYLVKPFSPRELVARVRALLRRTGDRRPPAEAPLRFDEGRLCLDPERHQAVVAGRPVELTPSEFKLLHALARSPGRVFSRFELINRVQGHDYDGYERTIDAHVKNLRRKIESDGGTPRYVQTVHGVGYRLAPPAP
jgi:DNA-binding response OmpR family regulator